MVCIRCCERRGVGSNPTGPSKQQIIVSKSMQKLHQQTVLVLNKCWQAVHSTTPAVAFRAMVNDSVLGLDIHSDHWMEPLRWNDWQKLPIRRGDLAIGTVQGQLRIPTVVVLAEFNRVPRRRSRLNLLGLWERDEGRCQYSGRKLTLAEANIDHVIPSSRGGESTWENCVLSDRKINTRKADRTPEEAGLTLLKDPQRPPEKPIGWFIRNTHQIKDWRIFLPAS